MNRPASESEVIVSNQEDQETERKKVLDYFGFIKQKLNAVGNNDSEFNRLDEIFETYTKGFIGSVNAMQKADEIFEGKIQR